MTIGLILFLLKPYLSSSLFKSFMEFTYQHLSNGVSYMDILFIFFNLQKMTICLGSKIKEKMHKHCTISILKEMTLNVLITEN